MQNIKLEISYDGSNYEGFQIQKERNTIQLKIEHVLYKLYKSYIKIDYSGRTDKGVHANMQCVNFICENKIPIPKVKDILNNSLPLDIRVNNVELVDTDFSSRYSCKSREYRYFMHFKKDNPFLDRFALFLESKPDIEKLNQISKLFITKMDFEKFSRHVEGKNCLREVYECGFFYQDNYLVFKIRASGFLWRMVRNILGFIFQHKNTHIQEIKNIIVENEKLKIIPVKPNGLFLYSVEY